MASFLIPGTPFRNVPGMLSGLSGEKGITVYITTGRYHPDALAYKQLGLDFCMITSNGAKIHDENNHEFFSGNIPERLARELIHTVVDSNIIGTSSRTICDTMTSPGCSIL